MTTLLPSHYRGQLMQYQLHALRSTLEKPGVKGEVNLYGRPSEGELLVIPQMLYDLHAFAVNLNIHEPCRITDISSSALRSNFAELVDLNKWLPVKGELGRTDGSSHPYEILFDFGSVSQFQNEFVEKNHVAFHIARVDTNPDDLAIRVCEVYCPNTSASDRYVLEVKMLVVDQKRYSEQLKIAEQLNNELFPRRTSTPNSIMN